MAKKKNPITLIDSGEWTEFITLILANKMPPGPDSAVYPTQLQPAADSFSTLCQRCELSRKAMSSWWVGLQQGIWCHRSPDAS